MVKVIKNDNAKTVFLIAFFIIIRMSKCYQFGELIAEAEVDTDEAKSDPQRGPFHLEAYYKPKVNWRKYNLLQ